MEAGAGLTRALLEAMAEKPPDFVLLQTRSPLVARDIDVIRRLGRRIRVSMTVESDREDVRRALTPSAPPYAARLRVVRELREAGIPVQIAAAPLLPHSPEFADRLAAAAPRVVVDDYFRGDGSGGRRSRALRMPAVYDAAGWNEWYSPDAADRLFRQLRERMPDEDAVGFSAEGFAPPSSTSI